MLALTGLSCRRCEEDIITRGSAGEIGTKRDKRNEEEENSNGRMNMTKAH